MTLVGLAKYGVETEEDLRKLVLENMRNSIKSWKVKVFRHSLSLNVRRRKGLSWKKCKGRLREDCLKFQERECFLKGFLEIGESRDNIVHL